NMGAPLVGQERLADSRNIARAVQMQEEHHGWKFRAVMSLEIGGNNSIQPLMAAAHLALPVVDADTMGRAYPEAQMTSVAVGGLTPYPCALYDPRGEIEAIVTQVPDWKWMERASRRWARSPRPAKPRAPGRRSRSGGSTSPPRRRSVSTPVCAPFMSTAVILIGGKVNAEMEHQTARDTTEGAPEPIGK